MGNFQDLFCSPACIWFPGAHVRKFIPYAIFAFSLSLWSRQLERHTCITNKVLVLESWKLEVLEPPSFCLHGGCTYHSLCLFVCGAGLTRKGSSNVALNAVLPFELSVQSIYFCVVWNSAVPLTSRTEWKPERVDGERRATVPRHAAKAKELSIWSVCVSLVAQINFRQPRRSARRFAASSRQQTWASASDITVQPPRNKKIRRVGEIQGKRKYWGEPRRSGWRAETVKNTKQKTPFWFMRWTSRFITKEEQKIQITTLKNVRGMVSVKLKKIIRQEYQTEREKTTEKSTKSFYITTKSKQW